MEIINGISYDTNAFRRDSEEGWYDPPVYCACTKCENCALNMNPGHCIFELKLGEDMHCEDCRSGRCRD
jgi:hypothetical protein